MVFHQKDQIFLLKLLHHYLTIIFMYVLPALFTTSVFGKLTFWQFFVNFTEEKKDKLI